MTRKRQFKAPTTRRSFFDRKVVTYGYSRMVAMGKVIPKGWLYVRIIILEKGKDDIVVNIHKLLGSDMNAQAKAANKRSQ